MPVPKAEQAKYERALGRYFRVPAGERKTKEREKILALLGVENPHDFLKMHIPLWETKVDELLDPTNTDMLPISIGHSYVNWVRGAIRMMPSEARVKIFTSKLKVTGLRKAILSLLSRMNGAPVKEFQVTDVQLVDKVHKDILFSARGPSGRSREVYVSHFGCLGEYIYAGIPERVGLPALPVEYLVTPQGEEVLVKPKEEGINIYLDEEVVPSRILREADWWVDGVARQDALGDCLGTALRYGHYVAMAGKKVVMIDNIELFHLHEEDVRIFEPIYEFLPRKTYPDDRRRRVSLQDRMQEQYEAAYRDQMRKIAERWAEIERYLREMHRNIRTYSGDSFESVLAGVQSRALGKG